VPHAWAVCPAAVYFRARPLYSCVIVMYGCSNAAPRGACCVRSCYQSAGVAAQEIAGLSTTEACAARTGCLLCHGLPPCVPTVHVHDDDAWMQRRCSAGRGAVCTAATGFAGVAALAIAELSTTGACTARMGCLLCRGLLSCEATMTIRDRLARVQQCRSADRMLCAQLHRLRWRWNRWI
jgi:hypothetical protein